MHFARRLSCLAVVAWALFSLAAVSAGDILPSDTCGECHKAIYSMWRDSVHARSMEDPAFLESFRHIQSTRDKKSAEICLRCHAPLAKITGDLALNRKVTWEGVTCDFCHSIVSVDVSKGNPEHRVEIGSVKRGPVDGATSSGHDVEYSPLHSDSAICAPCHEYLSPDGTGILTTYSEWRDSSAAQRGETCQFCHMPITEADVVDPKIKRNPVARVNLHGMPGGHSQEQLHRALKVTIEPVRDGDWLDLTIRLANRGAGHAVPTGMPGRRIILAVDVQTYEGQSFEEHRTYGKSFEDSQGQPVSSVAEHFATGIRLSADTRVAVDEERTETFRFPLPARVPADVKVKLHYEHALGAGEGQANRITFLSESRFVEPAVAESADGTN